MANIVKSALVMQYHFGLDSHGNPKITSQKFSSVREDATSEKFKAVGDAFTSLIDSAVISVYKEDLVSLEETPAQN